MYKLLRFGILSLLVVQLALGVSLSGARTLHAASLPTHGTRQRTGLPSLISELDGIVALSASNIWAVGASFGTSTGQALIEHWNGSHWRIVPS